MICPWCNTELVHADEARPCPGPPVARHIDAEALEAAHAIAVECIPLRDEGTPVEYREGIPW